MQLAIPGVLHNYEGWASKVPAVICSCSRALCLSYGSRHRSSALKSCMYTNLTARDLGYCAIGFLHISPGSMECIVYSAFINVTQHNPMQFYLISDLDSQQCFLANLHAQLLSWYKPWSLSCVNIQIFFSVTCVLSKTIAMLVHYFVTLTLSLGHGIIN